MAIDNQPTGTRENAAERRVRAFELRKSGVSYRRIGDALGVSEAQAHRDVHGVLAELAAQEQASAEEYRALELERLDGLVVEATRILYKTHPLVSGGKVLSGFTSDGKAIGLTDDGPKLAAIDRLLRISESRRKLLGLDAPAKVAPTNPDGTPYEAQQNIIGVVLNLLAPYPDLRLALAAQLTEEADAVQGEPGDGA
jgi:hypothetical protein